MDRPLLLLTSDDGVDAPGLLALRQTLAELGDVVVVAPEHNWSAAGHSKTMHKPLRTRTVRLADGSEALVTSGSPSDCVALILLGLLGRRPHLVLSGINLGANVGQDVTYSGTVAAGMESVIGGVSAVAVSLDTYEPGNFRPAAHFAAYLASQMLRARLGKPLLLNVNVPALRETDIRGVQITRLGERVYHDALLQRADPRGRPYYWIGGDPPTGVPEEGTDIGALAQGYISVTPILLDLTDYSRLAALRAWNLSFPIG